MLCILLCYPLVLAVAAQAQEWMLRLNELPQLPRAVLRTPQLLCDTPLKCTFTTAAASQTTPAAAAQQQSDMDGWEDWEVQVDEVQHGASHAVVPVECETLIGKLACLLLQNRAHELQELREAKTVNVAAVVSDKSSFHSESSKYNFATVLAGSCAYTDGLCVVELDAYSPLAHVSNIALSN
jgi:hypothetical protein